MSVKYEIINKIRERWVSKQLEKIAKLLKNIKDNPVQKKEMAEIIGDISVVVLDVSDQVLQLEKMIVFQHDAIEEVFEKAEDVLNIKKKFSYSVYFCWLFTALSIASWFMFTMVSTSSVWYILWAIFAVTAIFLYDSI